MLAMINEILTTILLVTAIIIAITVLVLLYRLGREIGKQETRQRLDYGKRYASSTGVQEIQQQTEKSNLESSPTTTAEAGVSSPEEYSWVLRLGKTKRKEEHKH